MVAAPFVVGALGFVLEALIIRRFYAAPIVAMLGTYALGLIIRESVRGHFEIRYGDVIRNGPNEVYWNPRGRGADHREGAALPGPPASDGEVLLRLPGRGGAGPAPPSRPPPGADCGAADAPPRRIPAVSGPAPAGESTTSML